MQQRSDILDKAHILVVDDDPGIRFALALKLRTSGFAVSEATDGVEALAYFDSGSADLVILDVGMPRMDGYTAAKALHAAAATRDVPLLFLTAQNLEVPDAVQDEIGRHRILTKPFSPRDVVQVVDELLGGG
jgi:two-component system, OmpR family, response regulator